MKKRNVALIVGIAVCLVACIFLLLVNVFDLNLIKHFNTEVGNFTISYYGNFSTVKIVKVYEGSVRRGTFELKVNDDVLINSPEYFPYLEDLNKDGHDDILIPHSKDFSDSIRYAVYFWDNEISMFVGSASMNDVANLTKGENDSYFSTVEIKKVIYEEQVNIPEIYESHTINTEYLLTDNKLVLVKNYTLIYYSETDAYCYVKTDYDPATGEIISDEEDWLSEKEASEIEFYK